MGFPLSSIFITYNKFLFIGWLGTKYDIVGRDKRNEELKLEIEKMKTKDETKKRKSKNKKRHYDR